MGNVSKGPAVLAIGSELLDGRVHESNALFVGRAYAEHGLGLAGVVQCDDVEHEITAALDLLAQHSSVILISGGLGPTTDDLTREAVANYCGVEIFEDAQALKHIQAIFEKRKRSFNPTNKKQATFPKGATIISNPVGTAPGFFIETERHGKKILLIALPGVPAEFVRMFNDTVKGLISSHLGVKGNPQRRIMRIFGLAESEIGGRIEALKLDTSIVVSYRAVFPEIQVKLLHADDGRLLDQAAQGIDAAIGSDYIFSRTFEGTFEECVVSDLGRTGKTIALAESCSGGGIGNLLTNVSGVSSIFLGSAVTYSNQAKNKILSVPMELIERHGAVSDQVAEAMANGARAVFASDIALSVTGIAGPEGGSDLKPVGTYHVGLADKNGCRTFKLFFLAERRNFKFYVAHVVLDIVRRYVNGLTLAPYERRT